MTTIMGSRRQKVGIVPEQKLRAHMFKHNHKSERQKSRKTGRQRQRERMVCIF